MIDIKNISVSYKKHKVLDNISISFSSGMVTAIYGESGIGKTTIAKVLTGLAKPDSGEVLYLSNSLWANGKYDRALGINIQMVYQQPEASLDPSYRIGKTLDEVLLRKKLDKDKRRELIINTIKSLGLKEEILGHYPYQISGGEAQRVSLARCLLLEPKALILDEATSMLDSETQAFLLNWLRDNYLNNDRTIIFISHDWELVQFYSNIIYVFKNGGLEKYEEA